MKTAVRWIGAVIALLVFLLVVAIAVGTSLPIAHVVACSAQYSQSPATLYATVEDDAASPTWRSDVAQVNSVRTNTGKTRWIETYKNGQTISYIESQTFPGRGLDRVLDDPTFPLREQWVYDFRAAPGGTEVKIMEAGYIFNPLFRLIEQFFTGYSRTIKTYMTDLGHKFGEKPQIACSVTTYAGGLPK